MADTRTPASRRAASNASASRLPSARERRPALAALAVLLIVGGAFASGFLALQAGNRADYLRLKADVPQGAELSEEHFENVSLPEDMDGGVISADDKDNVVGLYTVTPLLEGTILTDTMVSEDSGIEEGKESVTFGLDSSDFDSDLEEGAPIAVYTTSSDGEGSDRYEATLISATYPDGSSSIGGSSGTSTVVVKVLMDSADAASAQTAVQDDRVSVTGTSASGDSGNDNSDDNSDDNSEGGE